MSTPKTTSTGPTENANRRRAPKLRFGRWHIPLSKVELAALDRAAERHVRRFGIVHGFIRRLIAGAYRDV